MGSYIKNNEYIEDYDESPDKSEIGGTSNKKFARVKSEIFKELINELQAGKTNYYTYVNELIKSGYVPEYIGALIKAPRGPNKNNNNIYN